MKVLLFCAFGLLAACRTDYVELSRELGREELSDPRPPIVETQRTYYDRDTARPRLETSYRVFPGGRKIRHGSEREWYENGQLRWERAYADGEPTGRWTSYYPDGSRESETWPGNDPTERSATWWHANGAVSSQGPTQHGARNGVWKSYHPDGTPASEGRYLANRREGPWTFWQPDGSPAERGEYRAGQRVGEWLRDGE